MTNVVTVNREQLRDIVDISCLKESTFKVTITPISEEEADEIEFKSLKGIAGKPLDIEEIRKERLKHKAFDRDWKDFEDAVQYTVAESNGVDCIITRNRKDFEEDQIPCYSPKEFLRIYTEGT